MTQPPTPTEVRAFLETHGLTQKQLAELLPVPLKTLEAWLRGLTVAPIYLHRALRDAGREIQSKKAVETATLKSNKFDRSHSSPPTRGKPRKRGGVS